MRSIILSLFVVSSSEETISQAMVDHPELTLRRRVRRRKKDPTKSERRRSAWRRSFKLQNRRPSGKGGRRERIEASLKEELEAYDFRSPNHALAVVGRQSRSSKIEDAGHYVGVCRRLDKRFEDEDGRLVAVGFNHVRPTVWVDPGRGYDLFRPYWGQIAPRPLLVGSSYNPTPADAYWAFRQGLPANERTLRYLMVLRPSERRATKARRWAARVVASWNWRGSDGDYFPSLGTRRLKRLVSLGRGFCMFLTEGASYRIRDLFKDLKDPDSAALWAESWSSLTRAKVWQKHPARKWLEEYSCWTCSVVSPHLSQMGRVSWETNWEETELRAEPLDHWCCPSCAEERLPRGAAERLAEAFTMKRLPNTPGAVRALSAARPTTLEGALRVVEEVAEERKRRKLLRPLGWLIKQAATHRFIQEIEDAPPLPSDDEELGPHRRFQLLGYEPRPEIAVPEPEARRFRWLDYDGAAAEERRGLESLPLWKVRGTRRLDRRGLDLLKVALRGAGSQLRIKTKEVCGWDQHRLTVRGGNTRRVKDIFRSWERKGRLFPPDERAGRTEAGSRFDEAGLIHRGPGLLGRIRPIGTQVASIDLDPDPPAFSKWPMAPISRFGWLDLREVDFSLFPEAEIRWCKNQRIEPLTEEEIERRRQLEAETDRDLIPRLVSAEEIQAQGLRIRAEIERKRQLFLARRRAEKADWLDLLADPLEASEDEEVVERGRHLELDHAAIQERGRQIAASIEAKQQSHIARCRADRADWYGLLDGELDIFDVDVPEPAAWDLEID